MNKYEQFRDSGRNKQRPSSRPGPTAIGCIEEIPKDATLSDTFRLNIEVVRITEKTTNAGDPYWFVKCEDEERLRFDIVVWESQMRRLQLEEGMAMTVDVRIPKESYSAYTVV